jgi:DNA-binding response OmpR family regulator
VTAKRTTTPPRLLVVDDDARYGQWLGHHLGVFCPDSSLSVLTLAEFDRWCETSSGRDCDIMLLTAPFGSSPEDPKARGLELLRRLRGRTVFPAVIALAEEGNELTAVRALQLGAVDYLPKRLLTPERLNTSVRLALRRLEKRVQRKLASLAHVTDVALPEDDTTREQRQPGSAVAAVESAASALVEAVVEVTPSRVPDTAGAKWDAARVTEDAQVARAPGGHDEDLKAGAEAATAQVAAAQTSSAQAAAGQASVAQTSAGHAATEQTAAAQISAAQETTAQAHAAQTATARATTAQAPAAQTSGAQTTAARTPATQTPSAQATTAQTLVAQTPAAQITAKPADSDHPVHVQTGIVDVNALIAELTRSDDRAPSKAGADPTPAPAPAPASTPASASASATTKPETNTSHVTADPGTAAATQLMSPGLIAAALDAAAASAMAAGIKATESSVFGTTAVGAASKDKSSKNGSKKSSTPTPAVTAEFIPGYIIKMKIGESEKAVVYLATSISLGSNVALKVSKTLRDDTAGRQFLEREYTAIIAIRDPLVVQIYDYGVHAGFEYLAMEYLLSGDLKARMQAGLKESEALRYVEQIACALRVVHNAGLLHRDLKPPNVMLRENDEVALIDFGLARALNGSTRSTRTGVLRGSPYYMSPEQALGEVLDVRSDFYSLGIMFYEMLTGRKPYTGATAMEVLQQHVNTPLPPLPQSLSRYEYFLNKLVAKNRAERFTQAEEIIAAIGELRTAMTLNVESAVA